MAVPGPSHMHGTAATQAGSGLPRQANSAIALAVVSPNPNPPNLGGVGGWWAVGESGAPPGFFFFCRPLALPTKVGSMTVTFPTFPNRRPHARSRLHWARPRSSARRITSLHAKKQSVRRLLRACGQAHLVPRWLAASKYRDAASWQRNGRSESATSNLHKCKA